VSPGGGCPRGARGRRPQTRCASFARCTASHPGKGRWVTHPSTQETVRRTPEACGYRAANWFVSWRARAPPPRPPPPSPPGCVLGRGDTGPSVRFRAIVQPAHTGNREVQRAVSGGRLARCEPRHAKERRPPASRSATAPDCTCSSARYPSLVPTRTKISFPTKALGGSRCFCGGGKKEGRLNRFVVAVFPGSPRKRGARRPWRTPSIRQRPRTLVPSPSPSSNPHTQDHAHGRWCPRKESGENENKGKTNMLNRVTTTRSRRPAAGRRRRLCRAHGLQRSAAAGAAARLAERRQAVR
jgi:hypothetical protein